MSHRIHGAQVPNDTPEQQQVMTETATVDRCRDDYATGSADRDAIDREGEKS